MRLYNGIVIAQLTYGLNSLNITPAIYNRLNAFHMRGLRYMLKIDHSYYSHETNESVTQKANLVINEITDDTMTWSNLK